jgi:preprotein translocase subunit SecG
MGILLTVVLVVHVLAALGIIGLVLIQHGKGADVGAAFGGGASGSLFGATGSANFLSHATAALAVVFFVTSLSLAYLATSRPKPSGGIMDSVTTQPVPAPAPAQAPAVSGDKAGSAQDSKANEVPK